MDPRIYKIFYRSDALRPPARIELAEWLEDNLYLPSGVSSIPGRVELWPFQKEIAGAIGNPNIERVTLVKPVRVGFTTLLSGCIGHFVENDPSPVLVVLPAENDCKSYLADEIEPIFEASNFNISQDLGGRDTMLARRFPGGSLRIVPARAPRNLRRLTARILLLDEVDGMEITKEGDPVKLAEKRTISYRNRKIIMGSTPVFLETSAILRAYEKSDQRVFQVPCPDCNSYNQILLKHLHWEKDNPESVKYTCPDCGSMIGEEHKLEMIRNGRWQITNPGVKRHAGFHLNAFVSPLQNASWPVLIEEFLESKDNPDTLLTFVNTILAEGFSGVTEELDIEGLQSTAEDISLDNLPEEIRYITVGVDVQHDRLEAVFLGWNEKNRIHVLCQEVVWGSPHDSSTWKGLDDLLLKKWKHPFGGQLGVEAVGVDAGDGNTTESVLDYCQPRISRKIFAIKGQAGSREAVKRSQSARHKLLHIVAVDYFKSVLNGQLNTEGAIRFSNSLETRFYEELASERRTIKYRRGVAITEWTRIGSRPAESLDCCIYAMAVQKLCRVDPFQRSQELKSGLPPKPKVRQARSKWMGRA